MMDKCKNDNLRDVYTLSLIMYKLCVCVYVNPPQIYTFL